jgi:hypothetical protein
MIGLLDAYPELEVLDPNPTSDRGLVYQQKSSSESRIRIQNKYR